MRRMTDATAARPPARAAARRLPAHPSPRLHRGVAAAVGGHGGGPVQYRVPAVLRLLPVALPGSRRRRPAVRRRPGLGCHRGRLLPEPGARAEPRRPGRHRAPRHGPAHRGRRPGVRRRDRARLRLRVRPSRAHDPAAAHRRRVPRVPLGDGLLPVQGLPELRLRPRRDVRARGDAAPPHPPAGGRSPENAARRGRRGRPAVPVAPARVDHGRAGRARVRDRPRPAGPSADSRPARRRPVARRRPRRVVPARRARRQRDHAVPVVAGQGHRADGDAAVLPAVGSVPAGAPALLGQRGVGARVRAGSSCPGSTCGRSGRPCRPGRCCG